MIKKDKIPHLGQGRRCQWRNRGIKVENKGGGRWRREGRGGWLQWEILAKSAGQRSCRKGEEVALGLGVESKIYNFIRCTTFVNGEKRLLA